jgi:endonuclease YncB( thermonuclease family)
MNTQSLYQIKKGKKVPPFLYNYNDLEKMSRAVGRCLGWCRKTLCYRPWVLGLLFLVSCVCLVSGYELCQANTDGYDEVFSADVVKVLDGDTLEVRHQGRILRVRLFGIDAPEWQQAFSHQAKAFTRQRVQGQRVELRSKDWDKYGRLVAVVHVGGDSLNEELLREGLAWVHIYYCKEPICRKWRQLEQEARMARRGLWKNDTPVPPWKWKQGHK